MALLSVFNEIDETVSIKCHTVESIDSCKKILTKAEYKFKVLSLNIRSFQRNFDDFTVALKRADVDIDVIVLSECWLSDGLRIDPLPGYNTFRSSTQKNKNGGVIIYIKCSVGAATIRDSNIHDADTLLITFDQNIAVLGIYRSPSTTLLDPFVTSLDCTLNTIKTYPCIIVAGDLNIDICNQTENQPNEYLCLMASHGFLPAISKPTRGSACLDHIFLKSNTMSIGMVCKSSITDHDIVIAGMSSINQAAPKPRFKHKIDIDAAAAEIKEVDWSIVTEDSHVNSAANFFNQIMTTIIAKHTKLVKIGRKWITIKPWITPGLLKCMRHRDKLHLDSRIHSDDTVKRKIYTRYRNFCNKLLKKLKNEYNCRQLEENKDDSKRLWKTIKNICQTSVHNNDSSELLNLVINDPTTSLHLCNQYFVSVGKTLADTILNKLCVTQESLIKSYRPASSFTHSFFFNPTDPYEISKFISQFKSDSSPGHDRLTAMLLKKSLPSILVPLVYITNLSLTSGIFPDCWKIAAVSPIFKNGSKTLPGNYRPIALLSIISKVVEKVVNSRLTTYLERCNLLSERQFGFRRGKSTEDATSLLVNLVASYTEHKENCIAVFLDLAKAFDTVSVGLLLKKMESNGIRGVPHDWFRSYLCGRSQYVKIGPDSSSYLPIDFGVPQGSILGPTLFILYINDIVNLSLKNAEIITYADDTAILFHDRSWDQVYCLAEEGLARVATLLDRNLLTLNIKKTKYIPFSKTSVSSPPSDMVLRIHNSCSRNKTTQHLALCTCSSIDRTTSIKYLGITIDENLSFKEHIVQLSGRVRKLIFVMKKLRDCTPPDIMRQVYLALCQSIIQYCVSVWGSAGKTSLITLERAQRALIKVALRKPFRYPTNTLYKEFKVLQVRQLYILNATVKAHKALLNLSDYDNIISRRAFRLPLPRASSLLTRRSPAFAHPKTYNKVCKLCEIKDCTAALCKKTVKDWLLQLSYEETEDLL